jgi:hypothetical protein
MRYCAVLRLRRKNLRRKIGYFLGKFAQKSGILRRRYTDGRAGM